VPAEKAEHVISFTLKVLGIPWLVVSDPKAVVGFPILNMQRVPGFGPSGMSKDAHMGRAAKLIDLYRDWRRTGELTREYARLRNRQRAGRS